MLGFMETEKEFIKNWACGISPTGSFLGLSLFP